MLPFSESSGLGSEAIVYGASIMSEYGKSSCFQLVFSTAAQKKSKACLAASAQSFLGRGSDRHAPSSR
jgi:hypothetical protein